MLITKKFILSEQNADMVADLIEETLQQLSAAPEEILKIRLSLEKALDSWMEKGLAPNSGELIIQTRLKKIQITLKVQGKEANPYEQNDDDQFGDAFFSQPFLAAIGSGCGYVYSKGMNIVSVSIKHKASNPFLPIAIAIILALAAGVVTHYLPIEASDFLLNQAAIPLFDTFAGILTTVVCPMLFFAVVWGIYHIGAPNRLGSVGKKVLQHFSAILITMTILGGIAAALFTKVHFPSTGADGIQAESIFQLLLDAIPENVIDPFQTGNAIQIIVLAILVGMAMVLLQHRISIAGQLVEQCNAISQSILGFISAVSPAFVFLSIYRLIVGNYIPLLLYMLQMAGVYLLCMAIVFLLYLVSVKVKEGISPIRILKKIMPSSFLALVNASSSAAYSDMRNNCDKKLGIDHRLSKFTISFGSVVFKPATVVHLILLTVFAAQAFEIKITIAMLVITMIVSFTLAAAAPSIPGGFLAGYAVLFIQAGIPAEALGLAVIADMVMNALNAAINVIILQFEVLHCAKRSDLLNTEVLNDNTLS